MSQQFHTAVRRLVIWGGVLFAAAILQTSLLARLAQAIPYGAVPDLLLAATVAVAIFDGERTGALAGIAAGIFAGALGGTGINLLPVAYMLCGYVCGIWSTMSLSSNFPSWCVYMLTTGLARAAVTLVTIALSYPDYTLLDVAAHILLPEYAATLLFSVLIYFPVRRIAQSVNRRLRIPE
ncbi:MAG: hypothetical protein IKD37_08640 [Clostridia bacterium]|nr:hypothetical protein [Clostridia bacterium]